MLKQKKYSQVNSLVHNLSKNNTFILLKFDKTTHQSLEGLRRELKKTKSTIKVLKNTLFVKAINKLSMTNKLFIEFRKKYLPLKESSAMLSFEGDWSDGLHKIQEYMQKDKTLSFKLGILDNQIYGTQEVLRIAKLPSKNQLIGTIIGSMKSPATRLTLSLKFNLNKLVYILQTKSKVS